jgi:protein-tyrosine phosphatase
MTRLITPTDGETVALQTERQRYFREHHRETAVQGKIDWLHVEDTGERDNTFPLPLVFRWEGEGSGIELADNAGMRNAVQIPGENGCCRVQNLQIGKTYWWRAGDSEVRFFTTEDTTPRWIFAEGATNIRDAGGWRTLDGRKIRQGLLYRGSEFCPNLALTEKGKKTLREDLGIRTDLDFRGEAVGVTEESPLGPDVRYCLLPANAYEAFIKDPIHLQEIFTVLADRDSYPVYYHCWGGADRTGTIAYLLEALLGVPEDDLILDYELTSLSIWGNRERNSSLFSAFEEQLRTYDEDGTPQSRAEAYLLSCGVTPETIEKLRNNLLE